MSFETLETEREGALLRVWLNRPERRNALNPTALAEIAQLFGALQSEFETRVVVLGGRGPSFSSGADLKDPSRSRSAADSSGAGPRERRYLGQLGLRAARAIEEAEAVTIARVQGHAIGGGMVLAMACDFRIAARGTLFYVPEVDLGMPLTWGGVPRLIQELGAARARQVVLMCDPIDAERGEGWGMVHEVAPLDELDAVVDRWAQRILEKPEVAVHMTKTQLRSYAQLMKLGDVRETDGDVIARAVRGDLSEE
jgi:enoyl-CoA hydratase/carnithine racemase